MWTLPLVVLVVVSLVYMVGFLITLVRLLRVAREEYLKSNEEGYSYIVPRGVLWMLLGIAVLLMSILWILFVLIEYFFRPTHLFFSSGGTEA